MFSITIKKIIADLVQTKGRAVLTTVAMFLGVLIIIRSSVPIPGKHPHASQMNSLMFLLQVFGLLVLALASILVVNLISSMIAGNTKEIGIMKATGVRTEQIFSLYFGKVLIMGIVAVSIGLPVARILAVLYSKFTATMLNFRIFNDQVQHIYYVMTAAIGILLPFLASFFPIRKGVSITVREALSEYGISGGKNSSSSIVRKLTEVFSFPRSFLYTVRNTFRNNVRLALTVVTLTVGGAVFLSSLNIGEGIRKTISDFSNIIRYDIKIDLKRNYDTNTLTNLTAGMDNIERFEFWQNNLASITLPGGTSTDEFSLIAVPEKTSLFFPDVVEGEFVESSELDTIAVRHSILAQYPSLKTGDTVTMTAGGKEYSVRIKGVTRFVGPPLAYTSSAMMNKIIGQNNTAGSITISLKQNDPISIEESMKELERRSVELGLIVDMNTNVRSYRKVLEDHFLVIVSYLISLAGLIILVGGLGLSTTMSIQVIERIREIGVLRAIGALNRSIITMVLFEGLLIGFISWVLSLLLALPVTKIIGDAFGMIFFGATLSFAIWLLILVFFSVVAAIPPSIKALNITVRETLSYE